MRLILNEQEVIDGICVFVANEHDIQPEEVNVEDLSLTQGGRITARAYGDGVLVLNEPKIMDGIAMFLTDYHCFNPDEMQINLKYTDGEGIWAEVTVAE